MAAAAKVYHAPGEKQSIKFGAADRRRQNIVWWGGVFFDRKGFNGHEHGWDGLPELCLTLPKVGGTSPLKHWTELVRYICLWPV